MIQGHTFTALVRPSAFEGWWVRFYTLIHGLTAPMFLLGGGLAYGMVSAKRRATAAASGEPPAPMRIVRRGLMLLAIGYLLQWPGVPWTRLFDHPQQLRATCAVGPLQLVGVCLIASELLFGYCKTRLRALGAIALLFMGIFGVSPWVWQAHGSGRLWPVVGMWLDGDAGSLFPFFPWAAFFFLGVLLSALVPLAQRRPRVMAAWFTLGGAFSAYALYALWLGGERLQQLYGEHNFWHTSPMYTLFRAALVVMLLGVVIATARLADAARARFVTGARLFDTLSRQSLVAYVVHLLVLYGSPVSSGLVRTGRVYDLWEGSLVFAGIALFTLSITVLWEHYSPAELLARLVRGSARSHWAVARRGGTEVHRVGEGEGLRVPPAE
jgi:hypothetical protein